MRFALVIFLATIVDPARSISSSAYLKGFVPDKEAPLLFGKGIGPKVYQQLFDKWAIISRKSLDQYNDAQISGVKCLISNMHAYSREDVPENALSGALASTFQALLPLFAGASSGLSVLHQTCVPSKSSSSVDISISEPLNFMTSLRAAIEIKWYANQVEFPESQACAAACMFWKAGAIQHRWMPILILAREHCRIGVAYSSFGSHWAFSEIFETTLPNKNEFLVRLLQVTQFLFESVAFHRSYKDTNLVGELVDRFGKVRMVNADVLGDRVLQGESPADGPKRPLKIMKLYADHKSALDAMGRQEIAAKCLKYPFHAEIIEGCGCEDSPNSMCAVLDDFVAHGTVLITASHLISLTEQVDTLYKEGLIHGDLRMSNIRFLRDGAVNLIDFEWSGKFEQAKFPNDVNVEAFGNHSRFRIRPGQFIPSRFDWYCLADILGAAGYNHASLLALYQQKDDVVASIRAQQAQADAEKMSVCDAGGVTYLNLRRLGGRLEKFYSKKKKLGSVSQSVTKRKRRKTGAPPEATD
jgi:hypothetical protein